MLIIIKKYREMHFSFGSDKPKMLFVPLINIKMPTVIGILTFMDRKFLCLAEMSMAKSFKTSGLDLYLIKSMC